jgi:hypothetical protein
MSEVFNGKTGEFQNFVIPANGIIDAHVHIMSGNCSPLPLVWGKLPDGLIHGVKYVPLGLKDLPRSWISSIANSGPTSIIDKLIIFEQVKKLNESASELCEIARKQNNFLNSNINRMCNLLLGIASKTIETQRRLLVKELYSGCDVLFAILQFIREEIDAGSDLASDIDWITENVMRKIENARQQVDHGAKNADEILENYKINIVFLKVFVKVIEMATHIAEGLILLTVNASHTMADIAKEIDSLSDVCIDNLKELISFFGDAAAGGTNFAYEYGAKSIINFGANVLNGIVRSVAIVKDTVIIKSTEIVQSTMKKVDTIEIAYLSYSHFLKVQGGSTNQIGNNLCKNVPFKNVAFNPFICLTMDMEYALLDGYQGMTIYRKVNKRYYILSQVYVHGIKTEIKTYLEPDYEPGHDKLTGVKDEPFERYYRYDRDKYGKKGPAKLMYAEENDLFQNWDKQIIQTIACVMNNPWKLFPMYHYEPRRWMNNYKEPFSFLLYDKNQKLSKNSMHIFIGFKMYPSLGYHPLDEHFPDLKEYYTECANQKIPIMSHCSPSGMFTHEREHYLRYYKTKDPAKNKPYKSFLDDVSPGIQFFEENISSPLCWKKVLDLPGCKELKLCLAHFGGGGSTPEDKLYGGWFGKSRQDPKKEEHTYNWRMALVEMITCGDYPNLYTDFSCFPLKDFYDIFLETIVEAFKKDPKKGGHLIKRIMFGTDWYMTELDGSNYKQFYDDSVEQINRMDIALRQGGFLQQTDPSLWQWFSMINPFEFYNFYGLRDEIENTMKSWNIASDIIKPGMDTVKRLNKRITGLLKNCTL